MVPIRAVLCLALAVGAGAASFSEQYDRVARDLTNESNSTGNSTALPSTTIDPKKIPCIDRIQEPPQPGHCNGLLLDYLAPEEEVVYPGYFILYFVLMLYFFGGLAVAADLFMASIEAICSTTNKIKREDNSVMEVAVWNPTVANLSLMALGSSAPEILLAIIEIVGGNFEAGALGPGTIVGSAAYNMLMITAICCTIAEVKKVEQVSVFYITSFFSVFAYIWLYLIVDQISPNEILVWEGVVTILFFPCMVGLALLADKGQFDSDVLKANIARGSLMAHTVGMDRVIALRGSHLRANATAYWNRQYRKAIKRVGRVHPEMSMDEVYVAAYETLQHHPHAPKLSAPGISYEMVIVEEEGADGPRASVVGKGGRRMSFIGVPQHNHKFSYKREYGQDDKPVPVLGFKHESLTFGEDHGTVTLEIFMIGPCDDPITVVWKTVSGTAKDGIHYNSNGGGKVVFDAQPGAALDHETSVEIRLEIHNDDAFNLYRKHRKFLVQLQASRKPIQWLNSNRRMLVKIRDSYEFKGLCDRILKRLTFIWVSITGDEVCESDYLEQIRMSYRFDDDHDPEHDAEICDEDQAVVLGDDDDNMSAVVTVPRAAGAPAKKKGHSVFDWFVWAWLLLFKMIMALFTVPSTVVNGWGLFLSSLAFIGMLTAVVGDLATGLGCTIGLKDAITAISFVAIGTSIPDTFASKIAAEQDEGCDDAVGNVTGSNAVNVFLGVGLAWTVGSVYHKINDTHFCIFSGSLGFSVVLFAVFSVVWFAILSIRRVVVGGEIGGSGCIKYCTIITFVSMWFIFILLAGLVAYGKIMSPL